MSKGHYNRTDEFKNKLQIAWTKEKRDKAKEAMRDRMLKLWEDDNYKNRLRESHKREKNGMWMGGISHYPYNNGFNKKFKERVRDFWGRKCGICGKEEGKNISKKGNNILLHIHHVEYIKDKHDMVIPLCNVCHAKTHSNREYWEVYLKSLIHLQYNGKCF